MPFHVSIAAVDGAIFAQVNLVEGLLGRVRSFRSLNMMAQQSGVPVAFLQYRHLSYQDEMGNPVRVAVRVPCVYGSILKSSTERNHPPPNTQFYAFSS